MTEKSGRVFTLSLKPYWQKEMIEKLGNSLIGVAEMYAINHDHDINIETGEEIEQHTHFVLIYQTPRKLSTIANLFGVTNNFVEIAKSKHAVLMYLTHKNAPQKYQYNDNLVYSNKTPYSLIIKSEELTNTEIMEYIKNGKITDILDIVAPSRINQLSQIDRYVINNDTNKRVKELQQTIEAMQKQIIVLSLSVNQMAESYKLIPEQCKEVFTTIMQGFTELMKQVETYQNGKYIKL